MVFYLKFKNFPDSFKTIGQIFKTWYNQYRPTITTDLLNHDRLWLFLGFMRTMTIFIIYRSNSYNTADISQSFLFFNLTYHLTLYQPHWSVITQTNLPTEATVGNIYLLRPTLGPNMIAIRHIKFFNQPIWLIGVRYNILIT